MKRAAFHTLGCKVNAYESEAMRELLEKNGYTTVPFGEPADVIVINTCSVTNIADRKSRQMLHRARKSCPDAVVVAAGCYVQESPEKAAEDAAVDLVIGNDRKTELPGLLAQWFAEHPEREGRLQESAGCRASGSETDENAGTEKNAHLAGESQSKPVVGPNSKKCDAAGQGKPRPAAEIAAGADQKTFEEMQVDAAADRTRAFLKIQDGCNQFCSYCIIPYVRGRVRSRRPEEIAAEACRLAEGGIQEIVLTGIHLSSYGSDFVSDGLKGRISTGTAAAAGTAGGWWDGTRMLDLLHRLSEIEGIRRIRLGSLEPRLITRAFASELASIPKICPHFHLSLQSGSRTVLARMNRKYTPEEYLENCGILREAFSNPAITTDVIVGFPGETEEEFQETVEFVQRAQFYEMHVFRYSRREGTRADRMDGQIPEPVKEARSEILLGLARQMSADYRAQFVGKKLTVLTEQIETVDHRPFMTGHSAEYILCALPPQTPENRLLEVTGRELSADGSVLLCDC